jgi:hypothetical protein
MIYPSSNISKRDWAMQKAKKREKDMLKKHDQKEKKEEDR